MGTWQLPGPGELLEDIGPMAKSDRLSLGARLCGLARGWALTPTQTGWVPDQILQLWLLTSPRGRRWMGENFLIR